MPWQQTDPMLERIKFVGAARLRRIPFTALCTLFGIEPKTGYKWLDRFETEGVEGLRERSRRPHGNSRAVPDALARRLVALREENPNWGPRKLLDLLQQLEPGLKLPAASTVGELLKRQGMVRPRLRRLRTTPRTKPLSHATAPNVVWTMDYKGWFPVGDGSRCDPLTVNDAFSRYALCCDAHEGQQSVSTWTSLERTFREYGLPETMRVDNGQPWVAQGWPGLTRLSVKLLRLGIAVERIDPGRPQQNGGHERYHLTLLLETARPPAHTITGQQRRFTAFRRKYNDYRPHESLPGHRPPGRFYTNSPRAYPSRLPEVDYPVWFDTRSVHHKGYMDWRGHDVYVSKALEGERLGLQLVDEGCHEVYFGKLLIGRLHDAHLDLGIVPPAGPLPMSPV